MIKAQINLLAAITLAGLLTQAAMTESLLKNHESR